MSTPRIRATNSLSGPKCVMAARMHFGFLSGSHVVNVGDMKSKWVTCGECKGPNGGKEGQEGRMEPNCHIWPSRHARGHTTGAKIGPWSPMSTPGDLSTSQAICGPCLYPEWKAPP